MKYQKIIISKRGGPEVLRLIEDTTQEPTPTEVRIRVKAAGVAFADVMIREGIHPDIPSPPLTPGYDVAGIIDAVGSEVKEGLSQGQPVVALTRIGGYAEYINLPSKLVVPCDKGLDSSEVVSLALNYLTAYQMLHRLVRITNGECVLIHGAAGGVGTALLQLGSLNNLKMYGTASKKKHDLVEKLGGIPIDYQAENFVHFIKENVGDGVDAIFDPVGGTHWRDSYEILRAGGKLVVFGFSSAFSKGRRNVLKAFKNYVQTPRYSFLKLIDNNRAVLGYSIWPLIMNRPDWYREDLSQLISLLKDKKISPIIHEKLPLHDASKAHELINNSQITGKIILTM